MKQTLFSIVAFALCLSAGTVLAQSNNDAKEETILICKKGNQQTVIELKKGEVYVNGEKVSTSNTNNYNSSKVSQRDRSSYTAERPQNISTSAGDENIGEATQYCSLMGVFVNPRESKGGAYVERVNAYTPAARMGLQKGDLITDIDNNTIGNSRDFLGLIRSYQSGRKILVTFLRNDQKFRSFSVLTNKTYNDQMTTQPPVTTTSVVSSSNETDLPRTVVLSSKESKTTTKRTRGTGDGLLGGSGRYYDDYSFESANKMGLIVEDRSMGRGVRVLDVLPHSAADEAGMQRGDVIIQFNNAKITSLDDLQTILMDYKPNDRVRVHYMHNGDKVQTDMTLQKQVSIKDL
ncbi:MAG: PDZ domain-containing protein [Bacteroidota bacterium]